MIGQRVAPALLGFPVAFGNAIEQDSTRTNSEVTDVVKIKHHTSTFHRGKWALYPNLSVRSSCGKRTLAAPVLTGIGLGFPDYW